MNTIMVFVVSDMMEARQCVDYIKEGRILIINYREMPLEKGQRFFTFMKGCSHILDWECTKLASDIFLYSPEVVENRRICAEVPKLTDTIQSLWAGPNNGDDPISKEYNIS